MRGGGGGRVRLRGGLAGLNFIFNLGAAGVFDLSRLISREKQYDKRKKAEKKPFSQTNSLERVGGESAAVRGTASPNLLQSGHPRIQPPAADELLVRAALDEHAAIDDEDLRRVSHGGQPMRHHERAALPVTLPRTEGALHQLLRCGVERGGRLQKEGSLQSVGSRAFKKRTYRADSHCYPE